MRTGKFQRAILPAWFVAATFTAGVSAQTFVYPAKGQSPDQQKKDEGSGGEDRITMAIAPEGESLTLEVTDTGVGLPSDRGRLTEPYMTTRAKGTGLGLAIVKKIVEEHFGNIEFDDAPGGGTLVKLVFDAEALARLDGAAAAQAHDTHNILADG